MNKLTLKQELFLREYIRTKNATAAALNVYDCKNTAVASQIGYENLRKPEIEQRINEYLQSKELPIERVLKDLRTILEAKPGSSITPGDQIKGIELYFKLIGAL